jgi:hypothetical protein
MMPPQGSTTTAGEPLSLLTPQPCMPQLDRIRNSPTHGKENSTLAPSWPI